MIRSSWYQFHNYSSGRSTTNYFMGNRLSARVIVMNKTKKKLWKWAYLHICSLLLLYISFKINISRNFKEGFCVRHDICCNWVWSESVSLKLQSQQLNEDNYEIVLFLKWIIWLNFGASLDLLMLKYVIKICN